MSCEAGNPNICRRGVQSISRSLRARLHELPATGRVLAAFRRACIVQHGQYHLLAFVAPELGNGPLNALMTDYPDRWIALQPGARVQVQGTSFQLGGLEATVDDAETWEPCPNWEELRASSGAVLRRIVQMQGMLRDLAAADSMLALCLSSERSKVSAGNAVQARVFRAAEAIWAGWCGDEAQLRAGATLVAGLGSGLTPAGDDFALGTMLCAWLAHANPTRYCETVAKVCSTRTTILSRAFLQAAAAGECGEPWHRFLEALEGASDQRVEAATREVLTFGSSSGADALSGFLWVGLRAVRDLDGRQDP